METLYSVFIIFGIVLLIIATFVLIAVGIGLILFSNSKIKELEKGEPASSLNVLTTGEKYEVVDIYRKYIVIKSATDDGKLKFIDPLDFGTITSGGKYFKNTRGSLEKIE